MQAKNQKMVELFMNQIIILKLMIHRLNQKSLNAKTEKEKKIMKIVLKKGKVKVFSLEIFLLILNLNINNFLELIKIIKMQAKNPNMVEMLKNQIMNQKLMIHRRIIKNPKKKREKERKKMKMKIILKLNKVKVKLFFKIQNKNFYEFEI